MLSRFLAVFSCAITEFNVAGLARAREIGLGPLVQVLNPRQSSLSLIH